MSVVDREDISSEINNEWSQRLQRRVMRLLLMHDQLLFRGQFRTFFVESTLPEISLLQQYDRYIKLITLSDELLDDILPRIRRQLSLQTNPAREREEAPTHGDIDWQSTIERTWRESPGLPPIDFDTHLRQRSTATPENLLTVAMLLVYGRELQRTQIEGLDDESLTDQEQQHLVGIDERIERELAAPYARALLEAASHIDIDTLAEQVAEHLHSGSSPYHDLIAWWQRFNSLRIGRSGDERHLSLANKRSDDKSNSWLYELWIALEFIHFLYEAKAVVATDTNVERDQLQFTFTWKERRFLFRYNRQHREPTATDTAWEHGPASPPDYTIECESPLKVLFEGSLIWREPPFVMNTIHYLAYSDPTGIHDSIKKLLGDMVLLDAEQGVLFTPLQPEPTNDKYITSTVKRKHYRHHAGISQDVQIQLYRLSPDLPIMTLQTRLQAVLDHAEVKLPKRPKPICCGVWLDPYSTNASGIPVSANTILCPKPHIGIRVFDLVDTERHCLKDPQVCHVIGQAIVPPEVIRVTTRDDLLKKSFSLRTRSDKMLQETEQSGNEELTEQLRSQILHSVGRTVEQFVELRGNTKAIEDNFKQWVFKGYWKDSRRSLALETRDMLLSGEYVWHELAEITPGDWAAPAIQYCRALEFEFRRRIYNQCPSAFTLKRRWTLGTVTDMYHKRHAEGDGAQNWNVLNGILTQSGCSTHNFEDILQRLIANKIIDHRNKLAHAEPIPKGIAEILRDTIIGHGEQPGILCWVTKHLDPK